MENNNVIQFAQAAYEHGRAKKIFDNFLIGGFSNGIISIMLLVVDFYEIPYVFWWYFTLSYSCGFYSNASPSNRNTGVLVSTE